MTTQKNWEEIKDSLHLKISNIDIHTLISHFYGYSTDRQGIISNIFKDLNGKLTDVNLTMALLP